MVLRLKIDYKKAAAAFERAPEKIYRELRREMMRTLEDVSMYAKNHHRFRSSARGQIEKSILWKVGQSGLQGALWLEDSIAPHAKYIHNGTGLYGPFHRKYKIKPKNRMMLYWVKNGQKFGAGSVSPATAAKIRASGVIYSNRGYVMHPGVKPDRFLYRAVRIKRDTIKRNFSRAFARGIAAAGVE